MKVCILCCNERPLTEEHIVPDCIGGTLKPKLLCENCNSVLGSTIDGPFSNTLLVKLPRQFLQIPGKNGKAPNALADFGSAAIDGQDLRIRLDEEFKPYMKRQVSEQSTDKGLEISITIDKEDEGEIDSILRKKLTRHYRNCGVPENEIPARVNQELQAAKQVAIPVSHTPTIHYSFSIDFNVIILESIKIAYEIAALEFGEAYITKCPVAETLRHALRHQQIDGVSARIGVDLDRLTAILPGRDAHYVLLHNITCIVSIFGIVSAIEYCREQDPFACSDDGAVLYVFDPRNQRHARHGLAEFLLQRVREGVDDPDFVKPARRFGQPID